MHRHQSLLTGAAILAAAGSVALVLAATRPERPRDIRLLFTGDIMLSRQAEVELAATHRSPWAGFAELFKGADWVGGNFEGALGPLSECRVAHDAPCFATPDADAALIKSAGFATVTLENNHAGDLGAAGRARTRAELTRAGVPALDFAHSPQFSHVGDLTIAVIAVTLVAAADGERQAIPSTALAQKLRLAHQLANLVIVSIHWGAELQDWPTSAEQAGAAWLVDHGADLVVGHHPHVIQPPTCVHGHPVFYSLGNHVFDQKYDETKVGLIADCRVSAGRLHCGGIVTRTRHGSSVPVIAGPEPLPALAQCTPAMHPSFSIAGYTIIPEPPASTDTGTGVVLDGWKDGARQWSTTRQRLLSLESGLSPDGTHPLLFTLERHYSRIDQEDGVRPYVYEIGARGFFARWRGSALAWPLLDAVVDRDGRLCALHRGDSFTQLDSTVTTTRTARYQWNGFGFSGVPDHEGRCAAEMRALLTAE